MENAEYLAELICRHVAEIPDRFSPEDQPEMMLVTQEELRAIVLVAMEEVSAEDTDGLRPAKEKE